MESKLEAVTQFENELFISPHFSLMALPQGQAQSTELLSCGYIGS